MTNRAASAPEVLQDDKATAAEYVLGLLPMAERAGFEAILLGNADLQQDVAAWREYFSTFVADFNDRSPPPQLINLIEAKLSSEPSVPLWRQVVPYVIGAALGSVLTWLAVITGIMSVN